MMADDDGFGRVRGYADVPDRCGGRLLEQSYTALTACHPRIASKDCFRGPARMKFISGAAMRALMTVTLIAAPGAAVAKGSNTKDSDTRAWWNIVTYLASDAMEGRDTGSPGHARAVDHVAGLFEKAGLQPLGDAGGFRQVVPLHESRVEKTGTSFTIRQADGSGISLRFLYDVSIRATDALPSRIDAPLVFRGYCAKSDVGADVAGKIVVCFGGRRAGMPGAAARIATVTAANAAGLINIDDIGYTAEQPSWFWPAAYARTIDLRGAMPPASASLPVIRLNAAALPQLLSGSGHAAEAVLAEAVAARPLASFDLPARLEAVIAVRHRDYTSDNVLALLPGTDPALSTQPIVINAHIDGYGIGEPVNGDSLYNGAFDDSAYVATLVRLAQTRKTKGFARPVLFAVFTGEEKGLLGSRWFVANPPVPLGNIIATVTLDAIRPLFPLKILTVIGSDKSSLMTNVQAVGGPMGIAARADHELERGMIDRTDAAPFLKAGIPAIAFMFGYDNGSAEEARFRTWYRTRYHKPQDDIGQPIDFTAAADFNRFFYALTGNIANAAERPLMAPPIAGK